MALMAGDLVQYRNDPGRLAIIINVDTTSTGAEVCELVIVYDKDYPDTVGEKRYTNQDYWIKIPQKPIQQVEESRELSDEELEQVVGGRRHESFVVWARNTFLLHRKEQYDKQINKEPAWTRDD